MLIIIKVKSSNLPFLTMEKYCHNFIFEQISADNTA